MNLLEAQRSVYTCAHEYARTTVHATSGRRRARNNYETSPPDEHAVESARPAAELVIDWPLALVDAEQLIQLDWPWTEKTVPQS